MADKKEILGIDEIEGELTEKDAIEAYKFAFNADQTEKTEEAVKAFIEKRNSMTETFRGLAELQRRADRLSASLKAVLKRVYGVGPEDALPENVRWGGYQYTYSFTEGSAAKIADSLIKKGTVTANDLYDCITVSAMAKAAGVYADTLSKWYPGSVISRPKERVLTVR